ncbi:MAG: trans-sulfuration enzyme family protein [Solirubrobacterales bacterium]
MDKHTFSNDTEILYKGSEIIGENLRPESPPIYMSTAYIMEDLEELHNTTDAGGYTYNRTKNPNRDSIAELISYLENGEKTIIFSSGMAAISTSLLSFLNCGDHVLANSALYGETIDFMNNYLSHYGIEATYVDFTNIEAVKKAIRPNTKILYTEIIANPLTVVVDIDAISNAAHEAGAMVIVDSTFTTPYVIKPLDHGADLVVHSLTKYFGGHSDVTAGSLTGNTNLVDKAYSFQHLLGSCSDANSSWLLLRSARTMGLRVKKQLENAQKLAAALEKNPHVSKVNHPSLAVHPQHELAEKLFLKGYGAMLSFSVEDNRDKLNLFMRKLKYVSYLPTLGGFRTSLSHPVSSSHADVPEPVRLKMGIHEGLMRVSVGIEDIDDLIYDFDQALEVFDKVR